MLQIFLIFALLLPIIVGAQQEAPKQLTTEKLTPENFTPKQVTPKKLTSQKLTMDDAVQRALTHRPDLEALRYATQAFESAAKSERAFYFPTIGLRSDIYQHNGEKEPDSYTEITVNQQIYSFAGPLQKYQRAKNIAQVSELDRIIETNKTRQATEKTFLSAWLAQEKEKSIAVLNKSAQTTFQREKQKNKLEKLDKDVWLKNVSDYATSMAKVDQYEEEVIIVYKKLEFLMGESLALLSTCSSDGKQLCDGSKLCPPKAKLVWHYKKNYEPEPLDTYFHYALISRPEVPKGLKKMAIEKWNIRLAQGTRLPEISASAQAGCETNPNDKENTVIPSTDLVIAPPSASAIRPFWELRVSLEWSIFDGLVTQYREQQAEADKVKEMLQHEQDILNIKDEVHEKYHTLVKILKKSREQKLKYIHGRNHYNLKKQELELGRISQVDFDAEKTAWQDVQFDWISYNVEIASAECDLMYACGYPELSQTRSPGPKKRDPESSS